MGHHKYIQEKSATGVWKKGGVVKTVFDFKKKGGVKNVFNTQIPHFFYATRANNGS